MKHRLEEATDRARAGQEAPHARPRSFHALAAIGLRAGALACGIAALSACGDSGGGSGGSGGGGSDTTSSQGGSGGAVATGGTVSTGGTGGTVATGGSVATGGAPSSDGIGTPCPLGTECPATAPVCLSAGIGDATAYCSVDDCAADAACPVGFHCGIRRDPHALCGSNPQKGDSALCGTTNEPCIDPAVDSTSVFEGSVCLLRKSCLYRDPCAPCSSDVDCSGRPYQKCVPVGGEDRCVRECNSGGDCLDDESCQAGVCQPKAGACKGTGQFCQPCLNDTDCGDAGSTSGCFELSGGMRGCFDFSFATSCTTSADCPTSPSGKHGTCLDTDLGLVPGDALYHKCYLPVDPQTNLTSCW